MISLLFYFHVYAFLGWCIEVTYQQLRRGKFINRGMLAGPYCPIYGFGMVFLILFTKSFDENFFALFFALAVLSSILELVTGFLLDKIFHERWWDYSKEPLNIGGYICLRFSIIWGLGGAIIIKELHPLIEKFMQLLPNNLLIFLILGFSVSMFVDTILTVIHIKGLNREVDKLVKVYEAHENMRKVSDKIGKKISYNTAKASNRVQSVLEDPDFRERANRVHERFTRTQRRLFKSYPNLRGTKSELQEKILKFWADKTEND